MSEWLKEHAWKAWIQFKRYQEFESLPFRKKLEYFRIITLDLQGNFTNLIINEMVKPVKPMTAFNYANEDAKISICDSGMFTRIVVSDNRKNCAGIYVPQSSIPELLTVLIKVMSNR